MYQCSVYLAALLQLSVHFLNSSEVFCFGQIFSQVLMDLQPGGENVKKKAHRYAWETVLCEYNKRIAWLSRPYLWDLTPTCAILPCKVLYAETFYCTRYFTELYTLRYFTVRDVYSVHGSLVYDIRVMPEFKQMSSDVWQRAGHVFLHNLQIFLHHLPHGRVTALEQRWVVQVPLCPNTETRFINGAKFQFKSFLRVLCIIIVSSQDVLPALMMPCTPVSSMQRCTSLRCWMLPFAKTGMFTASLIRKKKKKENHARITNDYCVNIRTKKENWNGNDISHRTALMCSQLATPVTVPFWSLVLPWTVSNCGTKTNWNLHPNPLTRFRSS